MVSVCTGDFGTNARHPPRERIDSLISNYLPREGVAALPYTESLTSAEHVIIASNGAFPVRADLAVCPYTEFVHTTKITSTDKLTNAMQGGMLSVRAGRRKWSHQHEWCQCVPATSARTRGTHHASALIRHQSIEYRNTSPRTDTATSPYADLVMAYRQAHQTSDPSPAHTEAA